MDETHGMKLMNNTHERCAWNEAHGGVNCTHMHIILRRGSILVM